MSLNKTLLLLSQSGTQPLAINHAGGSGYGDNDRLSLNNCRAARESIPNSTKYRRATRTEGISGGLFRTIADILKLLLIGAGGRSHSPQRHREHRNCLGTRNIASVREHQPHAQTHTKSACGRHRPTTQTVWWNECASAELGLPYPGSSSRYPLPAT